MKIKQLPKEVYDLIAAGEVVLGPFSVVKELVENSLDAGAGRITIEISAGGTERIRVSDNGSGIAREDIDLAFAPHATSKLGSVADLLSIETLGFRGEALASIAAVSNTVLITKTGSDESGIRAGKEGGGALLKEPVGADTGTTVTVEQLFFNIPARRKHLSETRAERQKVLEYASKVAVSRPDVAFRFISDGDLVFSTIGAGDRLASIASVYGSKVAENLVPISAEESEFSINGYISGVLGLRNNRKGQHFFVNGRPVSNAAIEAAVARAYREFAEPGRFPVVFLFLTIDPALVDVNVHPAKSEVSIENSTKTAGFIERAIYDVLCSERAIPSLSTHLSRSGDTAFKLERTADEKNGQGTANNRDTDTTILASTSGGTGETVDSVDINNFLSNGKIDNIINNGINNNYSQTLDTVDRNKFQATISESLDEHYANSLLINELRYLATLFATYLLVTDGEELFIIDQHAAHERVNFERFMSSFKEKAPVMQGLLTPYLFTPPAGIRDPGVFIEFFARVGYEVDEFGDNTWAARSFPAFLPAEEAEVFLLESMEALAEEKGDDAASVSASAIERIMKRACKASVKANKELSPEEIEALLKALANCGNPYTCPHGRPVFIRLTRLDIERLFKRA